MGLFLLVACSEDAFQSEDETNGITATENTEPQRSVRTVTGDDYVSPWNINTLVKVQYNFDSNVINSLGYNVRITPYIGLAYYDGLDDGNYTPVSGGTTYNLAGGAYPNLYANGHEYGNYVQANPIVLKMPTASSSWYTHELWVLSNEDHCPLVNVPIGINYNLHSIGFDIRNNNIVQPSALIGSTVAPPPSAGTAAEERLLRDFGKVMYYKVEYSGNNNFNFTTPAHYVLALEAHDIAPTGSEWSMIPHPTIPGAAFEDTPFNGHLYFHNNPANPCKEINVRPVSFINPILRHRESGASFTAIGIPGDRKFITSANFLTINPSTGSEPNGVAIIIY